MRSCLTILLILGVCALPLAAKEHQPPPKDVIKELIRKSTVQLQAQVQENGDVLLRWHPANQAPSDGIKVVASPKSPQPMYPMDPYVAWLPGTGLSETVVPREKITKLGRGHPVNLRLVFVTKGAHGDLRAHQAISNVVRIEPSGDKALAKDKERDEWAKKDKRPEKWQGKGKDQGAWGGKAKDKEAWGEHAQGKDQQDKDHKEAWADGGDKDPWAGDGVDLVLPEAALVPEPKLDESMSPRERELTMRIHELEKRKRALELRIAQMEAAE
ncbi:MAG: hypothetical protein PF961_15000 [Planctomycetota bacterium]|nr:hypothetical protein [Planctomycetota bacterium]